MKKILALALVLALVFALAACPKVEPEVDVPEVDIPEVDIPEVPEVDPSDLTAIDWGDGAPVVLKVWGSQEDQDMLAEMAADFAATYAATTWDISFGVVGEPDAKARFLEDPAAAADVFAFPNDQLRDLVAAGALYELSGIFKAAAVADNGAGSVGSATLNDALYAFPMTADNGYFLYYDSSVLSADDVKTLDGMLAAADAAGKKVFMNVSNGWYIASFFLGAGGTLDIDADGNQICDFNVPPASAVGQTIWDFTGHAAYLNGDDAVLTGGFADRSIVAGVSGVWNADSISGSLGDAYAATKLPTMTLDGAQVQMSSFGGFKLIGVNSGTANPDAAMLLAMWLTNEANQVKRFEVRGAGPSNVAAAANDAVLANIALAALAAQGAYATSQNNVLGNYWGPAEAFGVAMVSRDTTPIQELLDAMVAQIVAS
ncbi:MAG: extracellular solute-binding protein [Clostridiales bacterium]|nr:extracellular solute-binding protein [Clostridiales bacterium]